MWLTIVVFALVAFVMGRQIVKVEGGVVADSNRQRMSRWQKRLNLVVASLFLLGGGSIIKVLYDADIEFDASKKIYKKGQDRVSLDKIKAVQVLSSTVTQMQIGYGTFTGNKYIRSKGAKSFGVETVIRDFSYNRYQLNIVFQDGSRQNISSYKSGDNAAEDGVVLSRYLKVPYWEDQFSER